jgi:hypothetical protein
MQSNQDPRKPQEGATGRTQAERPTDERQLQLMEAIFALKRLVDVAQGSSGQPPRVARLLLGLYNGYCYPFDLTELRALDSEIIDDCLTVLSADAHGLFSREIHLYFEKGNDLFQRIRNYHGIEPIPEPK